MRATQPPQPDVHQRPKAELAPGERAVGEALRGLAEYGEAQQILLVGRTGSGKTEAARALCRAYARISPGILIVVDSKGERRYDDLLSPELMCIRESVADLKAHPPLPGARCYVFRAPAGRELSEPEISEFGWALAARGKKTLTMRDEVKPSAARNMQWRPKHDRVAQEYVQGRSWGRTLVTSTTALRDIPIDCSDNADEVWGFQTRGKSADVLEDREFLHGVPPGLLASLKGKEAPPQERGEFVRLISGVAWNGAIYRFGAAG